MPLPDKINAIKTMRLLADGKVGIGTNDPQAVLHVIIPDDSVYNRIRFEGLRSEESHAIRFELHAPNSPAGENNRHFAIINKNREVGNVLKIRAQNDDNTCKEDILNIEHNGNVGIGTSSPEHKLDVEGSGHFAGDVGIGTTEPQYPLDVDGRIRSTVEVLVKTADWGDYIFEPDYGLEDFDIRMKIMKQNKHLPYIAPGEKIEKEGLPVSETVNGLTKNVEEMYLYIEALEKRISELEQKLDDKN